LRVIYGDEDKKQSDAPGDRDVSEAGEVSAGWTAHAPSVTDRPRGRTGLEDEAWVDRRAVARTHARRVADRL
jgi:phage/plasmid primase-like uncharacterized protein